MQSIPNFFNTKWLIITENGWEIKKEAPKEIKEEFYDYLKTSDKNVILK